MSRLIRLAAVAVALGWLATALPALAHAIVLHSDPPDLCQAALRPRVPQGSADCASGVVLAAPPAAVRIWFSEAVQPFAGGIAVLGPSGQRVEQEAVQVEGAVLSVRIHTSEQGTYRVRWQVVADDTHPTRGSFAFSVDHASAVAVEPPLPEIGAVSALGLALQVSARWLHFLGYALAFGVLGFRMLVLLPLGVATLKPVERRLWRLVYAGVLALLAAEPLALLGQTGSLGASQILDPVTVSGALDSSFGRALAQRLAAAAFIWLLAGIAKNGSSSAILVALALGALLALSDGLAAHATSIHPVWLGLVVNALHLATMGVWLGGLVGLLAVWRLPVLGDQRSALVHRFSPVAAASLATLIVTGAAMAWLHLTLPLNLAATSYGLALTAKLAVALLALPPVVGAARTLGKRPERWWTLEVTVLAGVLALAGLLVSLPPPA